MNRQLSHTVPAIDNRFAFLDYLRIFAFMSVLIGHKFSGDILFLIQNPSTHHSLKILAQWLFQFIVVGGAGVVVFFLISGYIITHVLQKDSANTFIVKRFFRIYPLYLLATLTYFFVGNEPTAHDNPLLILLYRLLLIGDFTKTPVGLHGVEWTLRIELYFYLFMFCIRALNIIPKKQILLPWIYTLVMLGLFITAPFPNVKLFNIGYSSFYIPFLFCGSMFYLYDTKVVNIGYLCTFIIIALIHYFSLTAQFHPALTRFHFVILALCLFILCWKWQAAFKITPGVLLLSNLTYPMYLFHHWVFDRFMNGLTTFNLGANISVLCTISALFVTCYLLNRFIETPCVHLGHLLLARGQKNNA